MARAARSVRMSDLPKDVQAKLVRQQSPRTALQKQIARDKLRANRDKYEVPAIDLVVAKGYPEPDRDYLFATGVGREFKFDLAWPEARLPRLGGCNLAFEIDGGGRAGRHFSYEGYRDDLEKHALATMLGWAVFRFVPAQLEERLHIAVLRYVWPLTVGDYHSLMPFSKLALQNHRRAATLSTRR